MLRKLRPRSAYDVMAALALFLVVTGGTAFAVVAANQVNSASIIDKEVKARDIADRSIGPFKLKLAGVAKENLGPGSVDSSKVGSDALTGANISEGTLAQVPDSAKLGGRTLSELLTTGGGPLGGSCNPTSTTSILCSQVTVSSSITSNFLVVASGSWFGSDQSNVQFADGDSSDGGSCNLARGGGPAGTDIAFGQVTRLGQLDNTHSGVPLADGFGLVGVSGNVPAGATTFKLKCAESNKDFQVQDASIAAVRLDRPPGSH